MSLNHNKNFWIAPEIFPEEEWRDIKGYEGLYQVSNMGRVKSLDRTLPLRNGSKQYKKGRILKPIPDRYGYLRVTLSNNSVKNKKFFVHRLVCVAFHKNLRTNLV